VLSFRVFAIQKPTLPLDSLRSCPWASAQRPRICTVSPHLSYFLSCAYKLPFAQLLSFDIHASGGGCMGVHRAKILKYYFNSAATDHAPLLSCALSAQRAKPYPFVSSDLRTLSKKCRVILVSLTKFLQGQLEAASHSGTQELTAYEECQANSKPRLTGLSFSSL